MHLHDIFCPAFNAGLEQTMRKYMLSPCSMILSILYLPVNLYIQSWELLNLSAFCLLLSYGWDVKKYADERFAKVS